MDKSEDYNENLHLAATGKLYQYGRELRQSVTNAESILWEHLRNRRFNGLKFRRQHPLNKYIADFYCHEKKLVIELDGFGHDKEYDQVRSAELKNNDIVIIRFWNGEVERDIQMVLKKIHEACS